MAKHSNHPEPDKVMASMEKRVEPKRVSITKAKNGYTISCYSEKNGEMMMIAKDMAEAKEMMAKMMA